MSSWVLKVHGGKAGWCMMVNCCVASMTRFEWWCILYLQGKLWPEHSGINLLMVHIWHSYSHLFRLEMFLQIYILLSSLMAILARVMMLVHLKVQLHINILIGFSVEKSLPGWTLHIHAHLKAFLSTKNQYCWFHAMPSLTDMSPNYVFGLSMQWVLSRDDFNACKVSMFRLTPNQTTLKPVVGLLLWLFSITLWWSWREADWLQHLPTYIQIYRRMKTKDPDNSQTQFHYLMERQRGKCYRLAQDELANED